MFRFLHSLCIWLFGFALVAIVSQEQKEYGPYRVDFLTYEICKGPKREECGMVRIDNTRNMSDVPYTLDFSKDCSVKNAKVVVGKVESNNKTKRLWNYQLSKPCQHFVLGPLLNKSFNLTKNCDIVKGHYDVHINMNDLTKKFLGSNFFYDTYTFKTTAFNNVNNVFCVYSVIKISKV